jgi:hypothetical protein
MKIETFDKAFKLKETEEALINNIELLSKARNSNALFSIHCSVDGRTHLINLDLRGSSETIIPFAIKWFQNELDKTKNEFNNLQDV